jgi:hypothetical protein
MDTNMTQYVKSHRYNKNKKVFYIYNHLLSEYSEQEKWKVPEMKVQWTPV